VKSVIFILLSLLGITISWFVKPTEESFIRERLSLISIPTEITLPWKVEEIPDWGLNRIRVNGEVSDHETLRIRCVGADGAKSKLLQAHNGPSIEKFLGVIRVHHMTRPVGLLLEGNGKIHRLEISALDPQYFTWRDLHRYFVVLVWASLGLSLICAVRCWRGHASALWGGYYVLCPIILISILGVGLSHRYERHHGFSKLVALGYIFKKTGTDRLNAIDPPATSYSGYDGGQYAMIALDPWDQDRPDLQESLDNPHYRYRRIGLPLMAWVLGAGQGVWVWHIYAMLNTVFWLGLLGLLYQILKRPEIRHGAAIGGIMLSAGTIESVRLALVDLPSVCLGVMAIWCAQQQWAGRGSFFLGYACLTRETCLAFLPAIWTRTMWQGSWRLIAGRLAPWFIMLGMVAAWFLYVRLHYTNPTDAAGDNLGWPGLGWWERWLAVGRLGGWSEPQNYFCVMAWVGLGAQGIYLLKRWEWGNPWWRMGIIFVPLYLCLQIPVWENYYAVTRTILPLTIAFNLLLALRGERMFWPWFIAGNFYSFGGVMRWVFTSS
jgi:hypothetical protein